MAKYEQDRIAAGKEYVVDTSSALPDSLPDLQDELMRLKYNDDQKKYRTSTRNITKDREDVC